jgi:large subunit ribosomal protein L7/L12
MSDYYDSKGIRHTSQTGAEMANERYLREERRARDKTEEFQRQQAELQAEQVRLAERQRLDQMIHNARVEAQLEEQAREEAIHREYTRDIQWLERSDAKGKFEFVAGKVRGEFVDSMARRVFDAFVGAETANSTEKAVLDSTFRDLAEANDKWTQADITLKALEGELEKANKLVKGSNAGCVGFGCLPFAIIFVWGTQMALQKGILPTKDWIGICIFLGCCLVVVFVVWTVLELIQKKRGNTQKLAIEPKIGPAREKAEKAHRVRQKALLDAKLPFAAWSSAGSHSINELVEHSFKSGDAQTFLVELVTAAQSQYPPLCRVDTVGIDPAIVQEVSAPLQQTVKKEALELHMNRSSVLKRLGASSNHEKLLAELSELSGARLAGPPIQPDPNTLVLTNCPPEKKIAIIKIVRELKSGLGLAEAKNLVENLPATLLENSTSSEIEKVRRLLEAEGAGIEVR